MANPDGAMGVDIFCFVCFRHKILALALAPGATRLFDVSLSKSEIGKDIGYQGADLYHKKD